MVVRVIAYGIARDILGSHQLSLELADKNTAAGALYILTQKYPAFEKLSSIRLAVNEAYVEDDFIISDGDEMVIIPPVSGG